MDLRRQPEAEEEAGGPGPIPNFLRLALAGETTAPLVTEISFPHEPSLSHSDLSILPKPPKAGKMAGVHYTKCQDLGELISGAVAGIQVLIHLM